MWGPTLNCEALHISSARNLQSMCRGLSRAAVLLRREFIRPEISVPPLCSGAARDAVI